MGAGVNLCLGTDSLATVRLGSPQTGELDPWDEMRTMADQHPALEPESLLRLSTINAARALGRPGQAGRALSRQSGGSDVLRSGGWVATSARLPWITLARSVG